MTSPLGRIGLTVVTLVALSGVTALALYARPLGAFGVYLREPSVLQTALPTGAILGPVLFILIQAIQVVIAPIPGDVTGLLGGLLFGQWNGFLYSTVGLIVGSIAAFAIGARFGAPIVERLLGGRTSDQLGVSGRRGSQLLCLVTFLVPALPKDVACYLFGVTGMSFWSFIVLSTLGRIPGTWVLSAQGAHAASGNYIRLAAVAVAMAALGLPLYWYRGQIVAWAKSLGARHERAPAAGYARREARRAGIRSWGLLPARVRVVDVLERQSLGIIRAARLLHTLVHEAPAATTLTAEIAAAEHESDRIVAELVRAPRRVLGGQLDREDIHALAVRLDDVLDEIDAVAERLVVYRAQPTSACRALIDVVVATVGAMDRALRCLRHHQVAAFTDHAIEVNRLENVADDLLRRSIAELFDGTRDAVAVLKWKEIYERLEAITDRCEDVTNLIEALLLKYA